MSEGGILDGIKVLDVATFIAGPTAATVMADFGADVIKIEPPGQGDPYRKSSTNPGNPKSDYPYNWIVDNRSKRSLALDLKSEEGRAILYRLVREADVFVTNMPFGVRERLRIRWDDIRPLNERLIYASLSAYGETGPEAGRTGFDSTALWARTGLMDLCKPAPDSAPARSLPGMGDHPTGISLFAAIMTGLYRRERTGKGGMVATNLMANGVWWNAIQAQAVLCGAKVAPRPAREDANNALHNLYRCRDGRWFHLAMVTQGARFADLCAAIGRPELADDPRFREEGPRAENVRPLTAILDEVFGSRDWPEWRAALTGAGLTIGEIAAIDDLPADRQMLEAGVLIPIDDPGAGAKYTVASPVWVEGAEKRAPGLAPALGRDSDAVLREAGVGDAEIARLRAAGVVA